MTAQAATMTKPTTREVSFNRLLDAPRSEVYHAWTNPDQLANWWGPRGFTNPITEVDLKQGGALRIVMRGPDGVDYPMSGTFREIAPMQRLSFNTVAEDQQGVHQLEGLTTVTFSDEDGKTRLIVKSSATSLVPAGEKMLEGMEAGWSQSLDRLKELVEQP